MTGPRIDPPQKKPTNHIPHPYDSSVFDATKEEAQAPSSPDPLPDIPYTSMTKEGWQEYLQEKLLEHRNGTNPKAMLGITKAVHALNSYENQAIAPNEQEILGNEVKGAAGMPMQMIKGTAHLLDDITSGHFNQANKDVIEGLSQFGAGFGRLPATALHAAGGDELPNRDEINSRAQQYGSSTAGLGALAAVRAFGPKAPVGEEEGSLAPEINPIPKDLLHMDEDSFMKEYRKGTMTPDQMDPYGLNDVVGTKGKKPLDDLLRTSTDPIKPLTPDAIDGILKNPTSEDLAELKAAKAAEKEAAKAEAMRTKIKGAGIGLIPGIGKYAKIGYSMLKGGAAPSDATAVSNTALRKALQASILTSQRSAPSDSSDVKK